MNVNFLATDLSKEKPHKNSVNYYCKGAYGLEGGCRYVVER